MLASKNKKLRRFVILPQYTNKHTYESMHYIHTYIYLILYIFKYITTIVTGWKRTKASTTSSLFGLFQISGLSNTHMNTNEYKWIQVHACEYMWISLSTRYTLDTSAKLMISDSKSQFWMHSAIFFFLNLFNVAKI